MFALGVVLLALGLLASIAWHELGHYTTARLFGVRVPEFMVGFGPTLFSRKVGETEFGFKAVPFGGYIRMIGMIPPQPGERLGRSRRSGPFQGLIDDVRAQSNEDFCEGDDQRQFWTRSPWKRIVIMLAGPFMNLVLAGVLFAIVLMGIGINDYSTRVRDVSLCAVPSSVAVQQGDGACPPGAPPSSPAALAGLRAGDRIISLGGVPYDRWTDLARAIRATSGPTPLVVERDGRQVDLVVDPIRMLLPRLDGARGTEEGSFVGFGPAIEYQRLDLSQTAGRVGDLVRRTGVAIANLPSRVPELFGAVFLGEQRALDSPVSVVGVSRMGGELFAQEAPPSQEIAVMMQLLAGVNLSLCVLNLLPILPLDGGHVLPAIWESARRRWWRWRGGPEPGAVDLARLMPVAYAFALVIMSYGALVVVADIINPIRLT